MASRPLPWIVRLLTLTSRVIAVMLIVIWQLLPGLMLDRIWWWLLSGPVVVVVCWSAVWPKDWQRAAGKLFVFGTLVWIAWTIQAAMATGVSAYYLVPTWSYLSLRVQAIDRVAWGLALLGAGILLPGLVGSFLVLWRTRRAWMDFLRQYHWFDVPMAYWLRRAHLVLWLATLWVVGSYGFVGLWLYYSMGRTLALFMTLACMVFVLRLQLSSARWRRVVALALELPFNLFFVVMAAGAMWQGRSYYTRIESIFFWWWNRTGWGITGWDVAGCAVGCGALVLGGWLVRAEWSWDRWMDAESRRVLEKARQPAAQRLPRDKEMEVKPGWDQAPGNPNQ